MYDGYQTAEADLEAESGWYLLLSHRVILNTVDYETASAVYLQKKDTQLLKPQKTEPVTEGELEKEWEQWWSSPWAKWQSMNTQKGWIMHTFMAA